MTISDDVRAYCKKEYVDRARRENKIKITIRVGDVHKILRLEQRYPLVSGAIGSLKFEKICNVKKVAVVGPINGPNACYEFELTNE